MGQLPDFWALSNSWLLAGISLYSFPVNPTPLKNLLTLDVPSLLNFLYIPVKLLNFRAVRKSGEAWESFLQPLCSTCEVLLKYHLP